MRLEHNYSIIKQTIIKLKNEIKKKKKKTRVKPRHFYHSHTKRKLTNDYDCSICMTMFL